MGSDACGEVVEVSDERDKTWVGKQVLINPNIDWGNNEEVQSPKYQILGMPAEGVFREFIGSFFFDSVGKIFVNIWYLVVNIDRLQEKPTFLTPIQGAALPLGIFKYIFGNEIWKRNGS